MAPERNCRDCGRGPLISGRIYQPGMDGVRHGARGLCSRCYLRARRDGTAIDFPRRTRSRAELLDDYRLLLGEGHDDHQIAARLGMTVSAVRQAVYRARRDGALRGVA